MSWLYYDFFLQSHNFISSLTRTFIRPVPLLEAMIVSDGVINSIKFGIEYIYYKIQEVKSKDNDNLKQILITKYNSLYEIQCMDRYILYCIVYGIYSFVDWNLCDQHIKDLHYVVYLLLTLPVIQNKILANIKDYYDVYCESKLIFVRYSCSKLIISSIENLDNGIKPIQNYQIFILYKYLSVDLVLDFLKSYIFIHVLYFLKNTESTYYYYKAIKLAYYYSSGFLFNTITKDDSLYMINIIIQDKRWFDIQKIEIVHAIYNIISYKYNSGGNLSITLYLYILKAFTLWNIVCLLKLFVFYINAIIITSYLLVSEYINPLGNHKDRLKRYITGLIMYLLLLLNTNDLVISVIFISHPIIYYIFEEILFFTRNIYDIKKVMNFYNNGDKQVIKTKHVCDDYIIITKQ
jgi:hypothetical protein